jgi:hypothetical protein
MAQLRPVGRHEGVMGMRSRVVAIGYSSLDGLSIDDIGSVWRSFARTEQDGVLFLVYESFLREKNR